MNDGWNNLKPAKEGEIRNPNGRPKGARSAKTILREKLQLLIELEKDGIKRKVIPEDEIWDVALHQAMSGDKDARRDVYDRLEGKPVQYSETTEVPLTPEEQLIRKNERLAALRGELGNDENVQNFVHENGDSDS